MFQDADFEGVFGVRGGPGISPALLMPVTVLQFVEQLTDRQAAEAMAGRIEWKYALSLDLEDAGERPAMLTTAEREELAALRRENAELRRANEILKVASAFPAQELDPIRRRF